MLLYNLLPAHAEAAACLHRLSFDFPWKETDFFSLLSLPTTIGWINKDCLIVCSKVLDEVEILTICVHPSARRQGKGFSLLSYLIKKAQDMKIRRIFLEVSIENKVAISLYEKVGFQQIGYRQQYYRTKIGFCDALCYEKQLC